MTVSQDFVLEQVIELAESDATPNIMKSERERVTELRRQASALIRSKNYEQALPNLIQAAGLTGGNLRILSQLGTVLIKLRRMEEAAKILGALSRRSDATGSQHLNAARALAKVGNLEGAVAALSRARVALPEGGKFSATLKRIGDQIEQRRIKLAQREEERMYERKQRQDARRASAD